MWRHGFLAFATVVVAFGAAPVTATIYTGTLNGLVTSGAATFFDELNEESGIFNRLVMRWSSPLPPTSEAIISIQSSGSSIRNTSSTRSRYVFRHSARCVD